MMSVHENYFYRSWVVNGLCPTALALIPIKREAVWAREPVWKLCWWRKHIISPRNRSPVLQPLAVDFTDEASPAHESSHLVPDVQRSPPPLSTLHASWNIEDEDDTFLRCVEKHWICQRSITSQNIWILKIVTILLFIWRILLHSPLPPSLPHSSSTKIPYSFFDWCKVKQSHYRPGEALSVPGGWCSQILRQSAQKGGKVVRPTHRPPLPQKIFLVLIFC